MYSASVSHLPDPERQAEFYEGVPIKRAIAWIFDLVLVMAMMLPVLLMTAFIGLFFLPLLFLMTGFGYRWLTLSLGSATLGMRLMSIEFRDDRGQRFDSGQAFLHTLGYTLSMSIPPAQIASIICMCVTERGQGLTDMVLGTTALNRRA